MNKLVSAVVIVAFLALFCNNSHQVDVGDRLVRTFGIFVDLPLNTTFASDFGFAPISGECDPNFGIAYAHNGSPSKAKPTILYFTSAGQLSGYGSRMYGEITNNLIGTYWVPVDGENNQYDLNIATRDVSLMCSGKIAQESVGDRLVVNQKVNIPLTLEDAQMQQWTPGNCITGMGIHHSYDLLHPSNKTMTWQTEYLLPVMPMYNSISHNVSATLINVPNTQRAFEFAGSWEGPFPSSFYCKNWCADSGCNWSGNPTWTTIHFLFHDHHQNTCTNVPCKL
eukprot:TRINITY_DN13739_c0_g1_i1.p1 TRINITY_DN13739_c0_g1~~TRINITY_DN13739_c0_g1_i1.p1  ORF type:complete len:281 (+),score=103.83 TRINITY_DN13739_c0_g1_i1:888-1730(+)